MSTCTFAGSFSFLFCFYLLSHLSLFVVFFVIATAYYASKRYDIMTEYHQNVQSELVNSQSWQQKWTDEETGQYQCYSVRMIDEFLQNALYMMVKEVTTATYISLESKLIRSQKHSFMYNDTCNCRYSHAWL